MASRKKKPKRGGQAKAGAATKLTPKQERFVAEYLVDLNATAAARRAGYSERNADKIGSELLGKTRIAGAIAAAQAKVFGKLEIKAESVLKEIGRLAFSDVGQILDFSGSALHLRPPSAIPEEARRAIAAVKVKRYVEGKGDDAHEVEITEFKLWDKMNALEKLARHLGLLKDKVDVSGRLDVQHSFDLQKLTDDELEQLERLALAAARRNSP